MLKCPVVFSVCIWKGSWEFKVKIQERELENCKRRETDTVVTVSFIPSWRIIKKWKNLDLH